MKSVLYYRHIQTRFCYYLLTFFIFNSCSKGVDPVAPATVPGSPTNVTAAAGNAQAVISFNAPVNTGGAAITSYTVVSNPGNITSTGLRSPITISGLTNGIAYTFTVTAANSAGIGTTSAITNSVTPSSNATVPGTPTNVIALAGNTQATISFSTPTNIGSAPITGYTVSSSPGNFTTTGLQSPITITGLNNGTSYTFTVTAINSAGIGISSTASNVIIPGAPLSSKNCAIVSINQYNNSPTKSDYAMTIYYDFVNRPVRMVMYDSLRQKKEYEASFVYQSDGIKIDQFQSFKIDPTTQQIRSFVTKADLSDPKSDDYIYEYIYNDSGYLTSKNQYINGSTKPVYKTTYTYDNNYLLIACNMILVSSNSKILESSITYETSQQIKSFIYTFPDGFESYIYSPIFNYGRKMKYPVKTMITKLYDPGTNKLLDTWNSSYSGYGYSVDGYISQGSQSGDLQQGFGLFYGKTSFTYYCQ